MALRATSTFLVSIETLAILEISRTSGIVRNLFFYEIGSAQGRVDSPPMSIQSAPFSIISRAL